MSNVEVKRAYVICLNLLVIASLYNCRCDEVLRPRILGGYATTIEKHPYMVRLWRKGEFFCGGTLITPTCVLTAAHCVVDYTPEDFEVYGGSTNINDGEIRKVNLKFLPKFYDPVDHDMDVAIIKLKKPFTSERIRAIPLDYSPLEAGDKITVAGWGIFNGIHPASDLRAVNVTVWSQMKCRQVYFLTRNMFCAGENGKDSCEGDSGGPAIRDGKQVGVVSWGYKCGDQNHPGVYTRLGSRRVASFAKSIVKSYC